VKGLCGFTPLLYSIPTAYAEVFVDEPAIQLESALVDNHSHIWLYQLEEAVMEHSTDLGEHLLLCISILAKNLVSDTAQSDKKSSYTPATSTVWTCRS
jgi:hypothetical protein